MFTTFNLWSLVIFLIVTVHLTFRKNRRLGERQWEEALFSLYKDATVCQSIAMSFSVTWMLGELCCLVTFTTLVHVAASPLVLSLIKDSLTDLSREHASLLVLVLL